MYTLLSYFYTVLGGFHRGLVRAATVVGRIEVMDVHVIVVTGSPR